MKTNVIKKKKKITILEIVNNESRFVETKLFICYEMNNVKMFNDSIDEQTNDVHETHERTSERIRFVHFVNKMNKKNLT